MERCKRENIKTETAVNLREDLGFDFMDMTVLLEIALKMPLMPAAAFPRVSALCVLK